MSVGLVNLGSPETTKCHKVPQTTHLLLLLSLLLLLFFCICLLFVGVLLLHSELLKELGAREKKN